MIRRILLLAVLVAVYAEEDSVNFAPRWIDGLERLWAQGIREDTPTGRVLGRLVAVDPENDPITYAVSYNPWLDVNENTGEVTLKTTLDREARQYLPVNFYALDTRHSATSIDFDIVVIDVNDNAPSFLETPYSVYVGEHTPPGSIIFAGILARDLDAGGNALMDLECFDGTEESAVACSTFSVKGLQGRPGILQGALTLKTPLDYETRRSYVLTIRVRDRGHPSLSSLVTIPIHVEDNQDVPPEFLNAPFTFHVPENTPAGTSVGVVMARDQDRGNPSALEFRINDDPQGYFTLEPAVSDGVGYKATIVVQRSPDREQVGNSYGFTVEVIERIDDDTSGLTSQAVVTIAIDDVNDFAPRFSRDTYEVDVPEDLAEGESLNTLYLVVTDNDGVGNNEYELAIQGDVDEVWQLSSRGGEGAELFTLTLARPEMLDFEVPANRQRTIEVVARETQTAERYSSTATVILSVFDVDDNGPKFNQDEYDLTGHLTFGDRVGTVTASDVDTGSNGLILYELQGDDSDYFQVDRYSGDLRYVGPSGATSSGAKTYHMVLVARDPAGHETSARLSVEMETTEVPVGTPTLYAQGTSTTTTVISGSSTLNPRVFLTPSHSGRGLDFIIVSGNTEHEAFEVNPSTSELNLRQPVTFDHVPAGTGDMFILRIDITNATTEMTTSVTIRVQVTTQNSYAPTFSLDTYSTSIRETASPGFTVLVVSATDQDSTSTSGSVTYTMQGSTATFQLDSTTGVLTLRPGADLASHAGEEPFRFLVKATDMGSPQRTGTADVVVTVIDVNNQAPTFTQTTFFGTVDEGAMQGTSVLQALADDVDDGSTLTYNIRPGSYLAYDGQRQQVTTTQNFNYVAAFTIVSSTGEIRTLTDRLQPDQVREVQFVVQVTDTSAFTVSPLQTATATVIIYIRTPGEQHINLNPVFETSINENRAVGSDILTLVANSEAQITFTKVQGSDPQGYFDVHSYTGKVTLARAIDYEQLNPPVLTCQIRAATASSTAFTTLKVNVQNINDNVPSFLQPAYSFEVPASLEGGSLIGIILATDGDRGNYGRIVYSISGPTSNEFRINAETGHLTLAPGGRLNAVTQPFHQLTVEATDDLGGSSSQSYGTRINITVFNDNYAVLSAAEYQAVVSETAVANMEILTVSLQLPGVPYPAYSITSGNSHNLFRIDPSSGKIYTTQSMAGHSSPSPYQLRVKATNPMDGRQSNSTSVTIWVLSPSPGSGSLGPMFLSPSPSNPEVQILEEQPAASRVLTVLAYSPSTASDIGVSYRLLPQKDYSYFSLDESTGLLTTAQTLDRETKDRYQVDIEARSESYSSQQTLTILLLDQDDHEPQFETCPGYSDPRRVSVMENQPARTLVTTVTACDADIHPNNLTYFYIVCGNDPSVASDGLKPFRLEASTGRLLTEARLDRERQAEYRLCVKVVPSPADFQPTSMTFESAVGDSTILRFIVTVADQDDNLPSFGYQDATYAAVLAEAPFHTAVVQIQAYDIDSDVIQYSLEPASEMRFHPDSGGSQPAQNTFTMDPETGVVYTNLVHYLDYSAGYFSLPIRATSAETMTAASTLVIYLIRSAQLMRFTFNNTPEAVVATEHAFTNALSNEVNAHISINSVRYHIVDGEGKLDFKKTDMCFHVINKTTSKVLEPLAVLNLFATHQLNAIYNNYKVEQPVTIRSCDVRMTTIWWSGYWYLWWILVALAIIVILLAIICMVCLWSKYKHTKKHLPYKPYKPYTMLDPFVIPYEYEETTVHM